MKGHVKNSIFGNGYVPDNALLNMTTDLPFTLHSGYPVIPGGTYLLIHPRAFKGSRFLSIRPGDSFVSSWELGKINPKNVRVISGKRSKKAVW